MSKKVKLNINLLKSNINFKDRESYIKNYNIDKILDVDLKGKKAFFYKSQSSAKHTDWVTNFEEKIGIVNLEKIFQENSSFGLNIFYKIKQRIFVINWGILARHQIIKSCIDDKFGIYTANKLLHNSKANRLKRAESRVNESNPINKNRHYGENIPGTDLYASLEDNEAIQELNIVTTDSEDFYTMIGKNNTLNIQIIFNDDEIPCFHYIEKKLESILDIYDSVTDDEIRKLFKGIKPITETEETLKLFNELIKRLNNADEGFFLFEPEIDFDYTIISKFKYVHDVESIEEDDFSLKNYLNIVKNPTIDDIYNDSILVITEDNRPIKTWTLINCIYGEIEFEESNYILSNGQWFDITREKYNRIKAKVEEITDHNFLIPDSVKQSTREKIKIEEQKQKSVKKNKIKVDKERIYNRELCTQLNGEFFDEISKQITLYEDRFEICDFLISEESSTCFFHVKYNSGASALSHLFNQGFVSASSYAKFGKDFSEKVNQYIQNLSKRIQEQNSNCTVHYHIINSRKENRLSFFSKMVLEDKATTLEAMGYKVKLSWANGVYKEPLKEKYDN